jgi:hypothetical protein
MRNTQVKRWIDRWNAYWFPETTTLSLAICRIVAVATQLFWFFPPFDDQINFLVKNSEFIDPQLLIRLIAAIVPREVFFTPTAFTVLYWVTVVAGVTALVGFFTRTSIFVFALGNWVFITHAYSYADIHHPEAVFCIFLMLLAFSPSGRSLSIDAFIRRRRNHLANIPDKVSDRVETAMWPLKLAHVLLALTYFSTGLTKLLYGGLTWMNGYTLQGYIFQDAVRREIPLGIWLGQQYTLSLLMSFYTIFIELFFFVSIILPRTAPYFFIGALLFQLGLYLAAGHEFFQHMTLLTLLLVFIDPEWWKGWFTKYPNGALSRERRQEQAHQPL